MATRASAAWATSIGLDTTGKKAWSVAVTLLTSGKQPGPIAPARATYFFVRVENDMWSVDVGHAGERFLYSQLGAGAPSGTGTLAVGGKPTLANLGAWLAKLEKKYRIAFRRDRPFVESTVKGGAAAAKTWIASL